MYVCVGPLFDSTLIFPFQQKQQYSEKPTMKLGSENNFLKAALSVQQKPNLSRFRIKTTKVTCIHMYITRIPKYLQTFRPQLWKQKIEYIGLKHSLYSKGCIFEN